MDSNVDPSKVNSIKKDSTNIELRVALTPNLFRILTLCKPQDVKSVLEHFQK